MEQVEQNGWIYDRSTGKPLRRADAASPAKAETTEKPSSLSALWQGIVQGGKDFIVGGAQLGARGVGDESMALGMGMPGAEKMMADRQAVVDRMAQQSEQGWQSDPARRAHPWAGAGGRMLGNVGASALATAPLMPAAAAPSLAGRLAMGSALGAVTGAMQPTTDTRNFGTAKLRQAGEGAAGGLAGGALGEVTGSILGKAIAGNSPQAIDNAVTSAYRRTIKPSRMGQQTVPAIGRQDQRILTAVDQIIENRQGIRLTDEAGQELPVGSLPRSIKQFGDALDQAKTALFRAYDRRTTETGDAGIQVGLLPFAQQLREIAATKPVRDLHPNVAADAERLATTFEQRQFYTPSEMQEMIQNLNRTLAAEQRSSAGSAVVNAASLLTPVLRSMRNGLDTAISAATGPGYQQLKNQYGALDSIERDVAAAVQREANKIPGGLPGMFADLVTSSELLHGIFTGSGSEIGRAVTTRAANAINKYIYGPNRAIERLFSLRQRTPSAAWRYPVSQGLGTGLRAFGAEAGGMESAERGPYGGRITGGSRYFNQ